MRTRRRILDLCLSVGFCLAGTILPNYAVAQSPPVIAGPFPAGAARSGAAGVVPEPSPLSLFPISPTFDEKSSAFAVGTTTGGLTIIPTFDSTIATNPNAAAIENSVNAAIAVLESLFSDPVTVLIYFRYTSTPDLANSYYGYYSVPYATYINALEADSKTANDATALSNLPTSALATRMDVTTALGRSLGLNTPGIVDSSGGVNNGGVFDGIVTLNSSQPMQFTRAGGIRPGNFDAQRLFEHEIDEVLGFGSILPSTTDYAGSSAVKPQDLFRYSASGLTSLTISTSVPSYFAIDGGVTRIVGFNQQSGGLDYGDWLSPSCAAEAITPLVQYAATCAGTAADVSATSPEGIGLDVIGYDLRSSGTGVAQTIAFGALSNVIFPAAPFTIGATASSGLPVTFTAATTSVCTVSGSTVTIVGLGTCSITASQAGNATYLAATPVTQSFIVTAASGLPAPTISNVQNAATFQTTLAPSTYAVIFGQNLSTTNPGRTWTAADFTSNSNGTLNMPTALDGTSVTIGSAPAYIYYISPGQINIITPLYFVGSGIPVVVKVNGQVSAAFNVTLQSLAPSFFTWQPATSDFGKYLIAQHTNGTNVGKVGLFPGTATSFTTPASPGETIILYGTGFGPTNPPIANGIETDKVYSLSPTPTATFGGEAATVVFGGLIPPLSQVYQFDVTIPSNAPNGDSQLVVTVNGAQSFSGLITVQQ